MTDLLADLQQVREEIDSGTATIQRPAEKKGTSVAVLPFVNSEGSLHRPSCPRLASQRAGGYEAGSPTKGNTISKQSL
jgi:hypothetical protein